MLFVYNHVTLCMCVCVFVRRPSRLCKVSRSLKHLGVPLQYFVFRTQLLIVNNMDCSQTGYFFYSSPLAS